MNDSAYYEVEDVSTPDLVEGKIDGLTALPDGRLAVACLEGSRIMLYDPEADEWTLFAEGLHEPMGVHASPDGEITTMQRPELTRLVDANGDGFADRYETVSDEFGISGNYDEYGNGPATDAEGNFFVSLSTANGKDISNVRGEAREDGLFFARESGVAYRGWVLRISPDGETTPWAAGFRAPNGIATDDEGRLFVTDQQGQWVGPNPIYHVREGGFYGFPSSLVWREDVEGDPSQMGPPELDELRTPPTVEVPYGDLAQSTTGLVQDTTGGDFGPFDGQLFVADFVREHVNRVMVEEVAGELQGACVAGVTHGGNGAHRVAFGPGGDLWVGFTGRETNWQGSRGLKRVSWTGETPPAVEAMELTEDGFSLTFTTSVDGEAGSTDAYAVERFYYRYDAAYGSEKHDLTDVSVADASLSSDGQTVALSLGDLRPGYVYALTLDGITAEGGDPLVHGPIYYTLNRLLDGTTGNPQFE